MGGVFAKRRCGVKLHFTLDHDGYLPTMMVLTTEGKDRNWQFARGQNLPAGSIVTFLIRAISIFDGLTNSTRPDFCRL